MDRKPTICYLLLVQGIQINLDHFLMTSSSLILFWSILFIQLHETYTYFYPKNPGAITVSNLSLPLPKELILFTKGSHSSRS